MDKNVIRTATFDDLPVLVDLARLYHAEAYDWLPFDSAHAGEIIRSRAIDTMDGLCRILMDEAGEPVGMIAGVVTMLPSAPVRLGVEMIWYVKPDHRGAGMALLDDFETWTRERGCIACSSSNRHFEEEARNKAMARFYERRGYRLYEQGFLKVFS